MSSTVFRSKQRVGGGACFPDVQAWFRRLQNQEPFTIHYGHGYEGMNKRCLWEHRRRDVSSKFGGVNLRRDYV